MSSGSSVPSTPPSGAPLHAVPEVDDALVDHRFPAELGPGLTLVRDWPSRVAVVLGSAATPEVLGTLARVGFAPAIAALPDAARTVVDAGPFAFLVLGPDAFADDSAVHRVRRWHKCAPAARLKLVLPAGTAAPDVLIRAIRAGVTDVVDGSEG